MTLEQLKKDYPGLYNQVFNDGKKHAENIIKKGLDQIFSEGKNRDELIGRLEEFCKYDPIETYKFTEKLKQRRGVK